MKIYEIINEIEIRTIPAGDKAKRSLYMPTSYFKNLGNKEKFIKWKQDHDFGASGKGKERYGYMQKDGGVMGGKRQTLNTPDNELDKSTQAYHNYDPRQKDVFRKKKHTSKSTTKLPGYQDVKVKTDYAYGPEGMWNKDIKAARARRKAQG